MRLSARAIINYNSVNSFTYTTQWNVRAGDPLTLYFQLIDLDQNASINFPGSGILGFTGAASGNYPGLRYLAGVGGLNTPASVVVTFPSLDNAKVITATATQDPNDSSIWSVSLSALQIPGTGNVVFAVTEGSKTRNFSVMGLMSVEYPGSDGCDGTLPNQNSTTFGF